MNCLEFRRQVGAEPGLDTPGVVAHREACPACARHQRELRDLDRLLGRAMRVDVRKDPGVTASPAPHGPRAGAGPARGWLAMAASLVAGLLVAATLWVSWPEPTLAAEVMGHAAHEPEAWTRSGAVDDAALAQALDASGARLRADAGTVTFAKRCFFDRHWVPHLVVQTAAGPVTVFLLGHREVAGETRLEGEGYEAIVLPAPRGSLAVVGRGVPDLAAVARQVFASVEWQA